jgi:hypothetical protein
MPPRNRSLVFGHLLRPLCQLDRRRQFRNRGGGQRHTAAAKSPFGPPKPPVAGGLDAPPDGVGRGALGTGGFPGTLGAGLLPTGGVGFGLVATGGGGFGASELPGRELAGESSDDDAVGVFFHGVADPLAAAMPGKTDTGLADALAVTGAARVVFEAAGGPGTALFRAGGGGAAAAGAGAGSR